MVIPLIATFAVPILTGLALVALGRLEHQVPQRICAALSCAAAVLAACCAVWVGVERPRLSAAWLPELGLGLRLGVDDLAAVFVPALALASVGVVLALAASGQSRRQRAGLAGCALVLFGVAQLVVISQDLATAALALTGIVAPGWALVRTGDDDETDDQAHARDALAQRLLVQQGAGTLAILTAVLIAGSAPGHHLGTAIAGVLLVGIVLLLGLPPVHGLLPRLWGIVPVPVLVTFAAVPAVPLLALVVRFGFSAASDGMDTVAPILAVIAALAVLGGGLLALADGADRHASFGAGWVALVQSGTLALALASGTVAGVQAAIATALAGIAVVAVLGAGTATGHRGVLAVAALAAAGVPGLAIFWPRLTTVLALWSSHADGPAVLFKVCAVVLVIGSAVLAGWAVRALLAEPAARDAVPEADADTGRPLLPVLLVSGAVLVLVLLGLTPTVLTHLTEGDLVRLLQQVPR